MRSNLEALLEEYSRIPEYTGIVLDSVETLSLFGTKPISVAAIRGIVSDVETLISAGANVNERGEHGYSPLHEAVAHGHLEVVKLLIRRGADPSLKNDDLVTPVELSVMLNEYAITAFLSSEADEPRRDTE